MRLLLIEDDEESARFILKGLRESGYTVEHAADGRDGLFRATEGGHDAIITDRMLPHLDGLSIVQLLRQQGRDVPVLVLSALGTVDDRVRGLRAGGDDYLTKPFAFAELLQIAQAEAGAPLAESASVDLAELVSEIVSLYEPAARDQGLTLTSTVTPARVNGSRQLLTQLLVNLLENAIEHAGRGCTVNVSVESTDRGARMVVADDGPGMAPAASERAVRPFAKRAAGSSTGTHLGLSLVASIARLHKGRLRLEDNAPGLRVVVEFE